MEESDNGLFCDIYLEGLRITSQIVSFRAEIPNVSSRIRFGNVQFSSA